MKASGVSVKYISLLSQIVWFGTWGLPFLLKQHLVSWSLSGFIFKMGILLVATYGRHCQSADSPILARYRAAQDGGCILALALVRYGYDSIFLPVMHLAAFKSLLLKKSGTCTFPILTDSSSALLPSSWSVDQDQEYPQDGIWFLECEAASNRTSAGGAGSVEASR